MTNCLFTLLAPKVNTEIITRINKVSRSSFSGNTALRRCLLLWEYCSVRAASVEMLPLRGPSIKPVEYRACRGFISSSSRNTARKGWLSDLGFVPERSFSCLGSLPSPGCLTVCVFVWENPIWPAFIACKFVIYDFPKCVCMVRERERVRERVVFQNGNVYALGKKGFCHMPVFLRISTHVI